MKRNLSKLIVTVSTAIAVSFQMTGIALAADPDHVAAWKDPTQNRCGVVEGVAAVCDLSGAELQNLDRVGFFNLEKAQGVGTNFSGSNFRYMAFSKGDFSNADFSNITAFSGSFNGMNLAGASFRGAVMRETDFGYNNLRGADLGGANIENFEEFFLEVSELCNTIMPDETVSNRDC